MSAILLSRVHGSHSRQNLVQSALSASGIGSVRPEGYLDRTSLVRSQQHGWSRQNSTPLAHASQFCPLTRPTIVSTACLSNPVRSSCPNRAIAASSRRHAISHRHQHHRSATRNPCNDKRSTAVPRLFLHNLSRLKACTHRLYR